MRSATYGKLLKTLMTASNAVPIPKSHAQNTYAKAWEGAGLQPMMRVLGFVIN